MLVSEQFLFWLYIQNWAGSALWKFLYLKMALMSLIQAKNSCGKSLMFSMQYIELKVLFIFNDKKKKKIEEEQIA